MVSLGLFFGTYYLSWIAKAGYYRAVKIGKLVPFNDQTMLMIEVLYGQMTAEQADRELARLESKEAERLETGYDGGGSASI